MRFRAVGAKAHQRRKAHPLRAVRRSVGLVFQYPEYQLFEETVEKDVSFAPRMQKKPEEE